MKSFQIQTKPFVVPTDDGKLIEEHFGRSTGHDDISVAHMIAPPHWSEPHQTPEFDEITYIIRGRKRFEIDGDTIELGPGQSVRIVRGTRVRYSNPFDEPCEYIAICTPAFSLENVNREEQ